MLSNTLKALRSIINKETLVSFNRLIQTDYPPSKFILFNQNKINVKCLLCGFPRTGTHWIRNVIEKSSGKKTFNLYENRPTKNDSEVLLIKVHARNKFVAQAKVRWILPPFNFEGKYIYVYRDPRDSIISMYEMYCYSKRNNSLSIESFLRKLDPIKQYKWEISSWVLAKNNRVLKVKFENLKENPVYEYSKIFSYLDLDCKIESKYLRKKIAKEDNIDRPRGVAYGWKLSIEKYKIIIDMVQDELQDELKLLGYDSIK